MTKDTTWDSDKTHEKITYVRAKRLAFFQYFVLYYFCNHLDGGEKDGFFTLTVLLISCDTQCSLALHHDAVG